MDTWRGAEAENTFFELKRMGISCQYEPKRGDEGEDKKSPLKGLLRDAFEDLPAQ